MPADLADDGTILRLFQVKTKPSCAEEFLRKFATTSAAVVRNEPGNKGFFLGRGVAAGEDYLVFASVRADLDSIKQRFGADWQISSLPPEYEDLIEEFSVRHIDVSSGWQIKLDTYLSSEPVSNCR